MNKLDHSYINGRNVEWYTHSEKEFGSSLKKKKNAAIMQSDYCPAGHLSHRNERVYSHITCTQMFITALFLIARKWKRHRYPSVGA